MQGKDFSHTVTVWGKVGVYRGKVSNDLGINPPEVWSELDARKRFQPLRPGVSIFTPGIIPRYPPFRGFQGSVGKVVVRGLWAKWW